MEVVAAKQEIMKRKVLLLQDIRICIVLYPEAPRIIFSKAVMRIEFRC